MEGWEWTTREWTTMWGTGVDYYVGKGVDYYVGHSLWHRGKWSVGR